MNTNINIDLDRISNQLDQMVKNVATLQRKDNAEVAELRSKLDEIAETIRYRTSSAKALYENMKEEGLSVGTIEAEGYYRAMVELEHFIDEVINEKT